MDYYVSVFSMVCYDSYLILPGGAHSAIIPWCCDCLPVPPDWLPAGGQRAHAPSGTPVASCRMPVPTQLGFHRYSVLSMYY